MMDVKHQEVAQSDRKCTGCSRVLPADQFRVRDDRGGSIHTRCTQCVINTSIVAAKKRRKSDPEGAVVRDRASNVKRYGITTEDFDAIGWTQDWLCAICGCDISGLDPNGKRSAHVDHNHQTGIVRGLLCNCCNRGLGLLHDSLAVCESAVDYLSQQPCRVD